MAWMNVEIEIDGKLIPNVVNIDCIVRYGSRTSGSYLKLIDGSTIEVNDPVEEITAVILKANK